MDSHSETIEFVAKSRKNSASKLCSSIIHSIGSIFMVIVVGAIGAALQRIEGGWIDFPQFHSNDPMLGVLVNGLSTRLFVVAAPFGLMIATSFREKKKHDPFSLRRISLSFVATIIIWFATYIDFSTYSSLGMGSIAPHDLPIGVFDWLIGHECKGASLMSTWLHQVLGLSLYGLVFTAPTGCWVYCFGYGWEFLFSGCFMGGIYAFSFWILPAPTNEQYGFEVGEAIWGAWFWIVMLMSIFGRFKKPLSPQVPFVHKQNIFLGVLLVLLDALFIGSTAGYALTGREPIIPYRQNLLGLITAGLGSLLIQVGFVISTLWRTSKQKRLQKMVESPLDQIDNFKIDSWTNRYNIHDDVEPEVCDVIYPQASKPPFALLLFIVRIIIVVWLLVVVALLIDVIVYDRILARCSMPWE